jgi:DNA repair exonuclease SbcCD ATPase subunit
MRAVKDRFEEFEKDAKALEVLQEALMDLDARGFEEEVRAIEAKLKDVSRIVEIEDDVLKLQLKIERRKRAERKREEEERKERGAYTARMEDWRAQGYDVARLVKAIDTDLANLDAVFRSFERDVGEVQKLRGMMKDLWGKGFDQELGALDQRLNEPDKVFENEEDLLRIKLRIERQDKHKAVRQEAEKELRERFRRTLDEWKAQGLRVDALEAVMDKDLDSVAESLEKARADIGRLRVLGEELDELDTTGHEEEVRGIRELLQEPTRVHNAEEAILDLQLKVERRKKEERRRKEVDERTRQELKDRILAWRAEGFVTDYLYSTLDGSLDMLRKAVEGFEAAARKMKELGDELGSLDTEGYDEDSERISAKMRDVRLTEEVENDILNLLVRSRRERQEKMRLEQIRKNLAEWKSLGYNVDRVEALIGRADIKGLEKEFVTHKIGIHTLKELEHDLDGLEPEGFEDEVANLRRLMRDIRNIQSVEESLLDLQRRIEERFEEARSQKQLESKEKHQYVEKLSEWVSEGFKEGIITRLEQVIAKSRDMDTVRTTFKTFETDVARVKELRAVLDTLQVSGFDAEIRELKERLANVDVEDLDPIESDMMALLKKIERRTEEERKRKLEDQQKRGEFEEQLDAWEKEGFNVGGLRKAMEIEDLVDLRRSFVVSRIRVQKLRELAKVVEGLREEGYDRDIEAVLPLLKDVDRVEKAEEAVNALRQQVDKAREAAGKRREYRAKMEEWRAQGYNTERLERALSKDDTDFISKEFLVFKIRLQKLEELKEEINILVLSAEDFTSEVDGLRPLLKDVDKISEIRERISTLKARIDQAREGRRRKEEAERKVREELGAKLMGWATQGYNVEELERVFDGPLDVVQTVFDEFERTINKVNRIREELAALDHKGYEGEVGLIASKLGDVRRVVEAQEELELLKEKVKRAATAGMAAQEEEGLRKDIEERIAAWRGQGYDVSSLEALVGKDLEALRKALLVFRVRVERLKELEEEIRAMDTQGFENRVKGIMAIIKDVDNVQEVANAVAELQLAMRKRRFEDRRRREEERKEKEAFAKKLLQWISEGYNTAPLENIINLELPLMRQRFAEFEQRLQKLKEVGPELDSLELNGHAREAKELRAMVMDAERVNEIVDRINTIRGRVVVAPIQSAEAPGHTKAVSAPGPVAEVGPRPGHVLDSIRERLGALTFEKLEPPKAIKGGQKEDGAAQPSKDEEEEEESDEAEPEGTGEESRKIRKVKKVKKKKMKR